MGYQLRCAWLALTAMISCTASAGLFSKSEWEKDDCTSRNSAAWCILHAFDPKADENYGIKDAMFSGDFRIAEQSGVLEMYGDAVRIGGSAKILAGKDTFMKHGGVGGTALFLMAMSDGRIYPRMRDSMRIFFWLPTDLPKDEAEKQFAKQLTEALKEIWGGTSVVQESNPEMQPSDYLRIMGAKCTREPCAVAMPGINQDSLYDLYNGNISFSVSKVELPAFFDLKNAYASSSFYAVPALYTRTPKGGFFAAERIITREEARQLSAKLPAYAYIYYPPEASDAQKIITPTIFNAGKSLFFVKPN